MLQIVLYILLTFSYTFGFDNSDDFINEINKKQNLWTAGRNFHKSTTGTDIRRLFGLTKLPKDVQESIPLMEHDIDDTTDVPEFFDARTQWPNCPTIGEVVDQSACGSDWAVSVASTISDRICIHSEGKQKAHMSARNILACCSIIECGGGPTYSAWSYWQFDGVVTGGPYGSNIGCQPYTYPPCSHYINGSKPECPSDSYDPPECIKECDDNKTINFQNDLTFGNPPYRLPARETQIQLEIMKNGPITAGFLIFTDFLHYKSGVYFKTVEIYEGYHAVKVIGWGTENGTKYWLAVNSWNDEWGDKGLFKIRRGNAECYFEVDMNAALPK